MGTCAAGFSLGKLQRDTGFLVWQKYEHDVAPRCEWGAIFAASPGNLRDLSAILMQQNKEGPEELQKLS